MNITLSSLARCSPSSMVICLEGRREGTSSVGKQPLVGAEGAASDDGGPSVSPEVRAGPQSSLRAQGAQGTAGHQPLPTPWQLRPGWEQALRQVAAVPFPVSPRPEPTFVKRCQPQTVSLGGTISPIFQMRTLRLKVTAPRSPTAKELGFELRFFTSRTRFK